MTINVGMAYNTGMDAIEHKLQGRWRKNNWGDMEEWEFKEMLWDIVYAVNRQMRVKLHELIKSQKYDISGFTETSSCPEVFMNSARRNRIKKFVTDNEEFKAVHITFKQDRNQLGLFGQVRRG